MPAFQYSNLPILGQASDVAAGGIVQSFNEIYTFLTNPNISSSLLDASALNASVPVGIIVPYVGSTEPSLWKLCNGQALSKTTYSALLSVLTVGGTPAYGSDATTFNLPDLRGRVPVGVGTNTDVDALGDTDGLAVSSRTPRHTHSVPAHKHALTGNATATVGGPSVTVLRQGTGGGYTQSSSSGVVVQAQLDSAHTHTVTIGGTAGSSAATDGDSAMTSGVTPVPFVTVNFLIKVGV